VNYSLSFLLPCRSFPHLNFLQSLSSCLSQKSLSLISIVRPHHLPSLNFFLFFLDEFNSFLSVTATTPHEFVITGDFNIHLDNSSDHATSQFLSVLSSFNLIQHVNFRTHIKTTFLTWSSLLQTPLWPHLYTPHSALHLITSLFSLNYPSVLHHCPLQHNIHFAAYTLSTSMIFSQMCCHSPHY